MPSYKKIFEKLNKEQKKAVETIYGPTMVIAGPGTGKTTTLTTRIAHILKKTDTDPSSILALTFTESGVQAMREKLTDLIGSTAYYVNIHTFHSFATEIISDFPDTFQLSDEYQPLSDLERNQLFHNILDEGHYALLRPAGAPHLFISDIIRAIQDLKRENIHVSALQSMIDEAQNDLDAIPEAERINKQTKKPFTKFTKKQKEIDKQKELVDIFVHYQQKLEDMKRYDFEDMIRFLVEKLESDQDLLLSLQERFLFVMVDEYQDTNSAQNQIVEILTRDVEQPNIFVVGDDEQAIYRFQGASLKNILDFTTIFPDAKIITLKNNYRSTKRIVNSARSVIDHNVLKLENEINIDKSQTVEKEKGEKISHYEFSDGDFENIFLTQHIKNLSRKGVDLSEIAILVRNNADINQLEDVLSSAGIPYVLRRGKNILQLGEVNRFLNLLKLIRDIRTAPSDDILFFTVLNYEFLQINPLDIIKLARFASERKQNMFDVILTQEVSDARLDDLDAVKSFVVKLYSWSQLAQTSSFIHFFECVLNDSGYLRWVLDKRHDMNSFLSIQTLFDQAKQMNYATHSLTLEGFLEAIEVMKENNIQITTRYISSNKQAVNLITAHGSKGLEFDHVILARCIDKKWGNTRDINRVPLPEHMVVDSTIDKKERNEDERRLFYVSLTRARESVTITSAEKYMFNGDERATMGSMFIAEIDDALLTKQKTKELEEPLRQYMLKTNKVTKEPDHEAEEEDFLRSLITNLTLSVTSLNTYLQCHYKFKLNTILKTPRTKEPPLSFGTAIHSALEAFYREYKRNDDKPPEKILIEEFTTALDRELLAVMDKERLLARGKKILHAFYQSEQDEDPISLEYTVGKRKVYLKDIPLSGKIDRIDWENKDKREVKIIDYKTGSTKTKGQILGTTKNSTGDLIRQLVFYKLLTQLDTRFNYDATHGEFVFVEDKGAPKHVTFNYDQKNIDDLKNLIQEEMKKIRALEFERTTDYSTCQTCPYQHHCWPDGIPK